jgi:hypothetical protein
MVGTSPSLKGNVGRRGLGLKNRRRKYLSPLGYRNILNTCLNKQFLKDCVIICFEGAI